MNSTEYMNKLRAEKGEVFAMAISSIAMGIALVHMLDGADMPEDQKSEIAQELLEFQSMSAFTIQQAGQFDAKEMQEATDAYFDLVASDASALKNNTTH